MGEQLAGEALREGDIEKSGGIGRVGKNVAEVLGAGVEVLITSGRAAREGDRVAHVSAPGGKP